MKKKGKFKEKIKGAAGKIKDTGKKIGRKIKDTAKKVPFAPLLPFAVAMRIILTGKGKTPETKFERLCQQFYSVVIEKKENYELTNTEHLAPAIVTAIISGVLGYFSELKKRKKDGVTLSKGEEQALNIAEKTTDEVMNVGKDIAYKETAEKGFPIAVMLIVGLVVFMILKK